MSEHENGQLLAEACARYMFEDDAASQAMGMSIEAAYDKPIHISEFGAGAKYGRSGGAAHIWSEEYQAAVYRAQLGMLRNSPQVQGMSPWILKDFRSMMRPLAGVQDYYNRKGLIDEHGRRKQAFFILRDFYRQAWQSAP